jgi:hypothetical protein
MMRLPLRYSPETTYLRRTPLPIFHPALHARLTKHVHNDTVLELIRPSLSIRSSGDR